jgi:hypothetical protein
MRSISRTALLKRGWSRPFIDLLLPSESQDFRSANVQVQDWEGRTVLARYYFVERIREMEAQNGFEEKRKRLRSKKASLVQRAAPGLPKLSQLEAHVTKSANLRK